MRLETGFIFLFLALYAFPPEISDSLKLEKRKREEKEGFFLGGDFECPDFVLNLLSRI